MSAEFLQKIFRTLGDPTRVRIGLLLEQEELAVQELMDVLGMAQSRVSRHLGILREAALVRDRRDGTFALYRFLPPEDEAWRLRAIGDRVPLSENGSGSRRAGPRDDAGRGIHHALLPGPRRQTRNRVSSGDSCASSGNGRA